MGIKNLLLKISCICTETCFYRCMNIIDFFGNQHIQAKSKTYINMILEFGKIIIGCLLVFAVPQLCNGIEPNLQMILENFNVSNYNFTLNNSIFQEHPCTINEIFADIFGYKIFVIIWNFLCLMLFFINFTLELYRERYIINNFEYTISKPLKNIFHILKNNTQVENKYMKISRYLYYMNYICSSVMFLNIIFTGILVYMYGYDGYRSITGLFSSVLLTLEKLYYNYSVLDLVINQHWVFSTKNVNPVCYNVLNPRTYYHSNCNGENADDLFDIEKVNPQKSYNYLSDLQYFPLTENKSKKIFRRLYRTEASIKLKEIQGINRKYNGKLHKPFFSIARNIKNTKNTKQAKNKLSIERTIKIEKIRNVLENTVENNDNYKLGIESDTERDLYIDVTEDNTISDNVGSGMHMNRDSRWNNKSKKYTSQDKLQANIDFLDAQSII